MLTTSTGAESHCGAALLNGWHLVELLSNHPHKPAIGNHLVTDKFL
jgi:hypothetical protein